MKRGEFKPEGVVCVFINSECSAPALFRLKDDGDMFIGDRKFIVYIVVDIFTVYRHDPIALFEP
jgi:hypothetical protein